MTSHVFFSFEFGRLSIMCAEVRIVSLMLLFFFILEFNFDRKHLALIQHTITSSRLEFS